MSFEPLDIAADLARDRKVRSSSDLFLTRPPGLYRNGIKRLLDVALVLLALPFVLPVVLLIAVMIALHDGHSPFYWSARVGRYGREFGMLKLRSMVPDADARLAAYLASDPEAAAEWQSTQKLKADPRITAFGRMLRKTSLDELPQLWNVLRGDMSLVGPRPMMPDQRPIYPGKAYFALRPGVSGPWQVSDRNASTFARRADFDLEYHRTLTFTNDVKLILQTLAVVLRGTGY
jgi:lipopolysaccharide/colanic/teichoic acid biosynthesis glycosyltransferase